MLDGVAVGAKESLKAEWMYRWDYAQTTYQSIIKQKKIIIIHYSKEPEGGMDV